MIWKFDGFFLMNMEIFFGSFGYDIKEKIFLQMFLVFVVIFIYNYCFFNNYNID